MIHLDGATQREKCKTACLAPNPPKADRHSRENGNPPFGTPVCRQAGWTPTFVGVTGLGELSFALVSHPNLYP